MNILRQGDPLAPILFILMTTALSESINAAAETGLLRCFRRQGLPSPITHTLFVDDTLIVGEATSTKMQEYVSILNTHLLACGQRIFIFLGDWLSYCMCVWLTYMNQISNGKGTHSRHAPWLLDKPLLFHPLPLLYRVGF